MNIQLNEKINFKSVCHHDRTKILFGVKTAQLHDMATVETAFGRLKKQSEQTNVTFGTGRVRTDRCRLCNRRHSQLGFCLAQIQLV